MALTVVPTLPAAVAAFNAGSGTVAPGGNVTIPITVTGSWSQDWIGTDFTLTWEPGAMSISSGTPQGTFSSGSAFNPANGKFSWNSAGSGVSGGDTLMTVTFAASPTALPGTYQVSFTPNSASAPLEIGFADASSMTPGFSAGSIEVVPEPVNIALGIFGICFGGTAVIKSLKRRAKCSAS